MATITILDLDVSDIVPGQQITAAEMITRIEALETWCQLVADNAFNADGSVQMTGHIQMNSKKVTGMLDGTADKDGATVGQIGILTNSISVNNEAVNVKIFGATGDGTDQTTEIAAAVASISGSGVVYFPEGIYLISSTITIPTGVVLQGINTHYSGGQGTRITSTVAAAACFQMGDGSTLTHSGGVKNMRITASGAGIDGTGIYLYYTRWCVIDSVNVTGFTTGTGIQIGGQASGGGAAAQNTVSNVYLNTNLVNLLLTGENANNTSSCDEAIFTNVRIAPAGLANSVGLRMNKGLNNSFRSLVMSDSGGTTAGTIGIDIANGGATVDSLAARGNTFVMTAIENFSTAIQIGTTPHSNTFLETRLHIQETKTMLSDSSGGGNRFIGISGSENLAQDSMIYTPYNPLNLAVNSEFERWDAGTAVAPTGWSLGGNDGESVARSADKRKGTYSAALTSASENARLLQTLPVYAHLKGHYVSASCWVKANYTPSAASRVQLRIDDGVGNTKSKTHSGGDSWELLTVKRKIDGSATKVQFDIDMANATDTIEIDQAQISEGIDVPLPGGTPITESTLPDNAISLLSTTIVPLNANGDTAIYTVPTGKTCILSHGVLVGGADAGTSDISIGQNGAETDFVGVTNLDNLDAANEMVLIAPVPSATPATLKAYAAATVIEAQVSNEDGGATNTLYLYGMLF